MNLRFGRNYPFSMGRGFGIHTWNWSHIQTSGSSRVEYITALDTKKGMKFNNPLQHRCFFGQQEDRAKQRKKSVWVVGNLIQVQITCLLHKIQRHYSHNNLVGCSGQKLMVLKNWLYHQAANMIKNWNVSGSSTVQHVILTLRRLMSYIYGAPILDVSRSHTMQHSR